MKLTTLDYELIETQSIETGCGKVVPFAVPQKVIVAVPRNSPHPKTYLACGDSLKDRGINHGDTLLCKTRFSIYETKNKVCVIYINGEYIAKIVIPNTDGSITLRSANPYYMDVKVDADFEIVGIVTKIQRDI